MRWIVGLDLRPHGAGAIEMVRWMVEHANASADLSFVGIHVVPPAGPAVRSDVLDEVCGRRVEQAEAMLREVGVLDAFERIEAIPGDDAARTLEAVVHDERADGLLIGRRAPRDGHSLVRLGRCARRLIRSLPAAVMVVPPGTAAADIGEGPIIVASDLKAASLGVGRFSLKLARALSRDLMVVSAWRPAARASAEWDSLVDAYDGDDSDPDATERWLIDQGLGGAIGVRDRGDPVDALLRAGKEHDAAVLACGSRHLSLAKRAFVASTGTDLARVSRRPVLIVPPEQDQ